MMNKFAPLINCFLLVLLISCAGLQPQTITPPQQIIPPEQITPQEQITIPEQAALSQPDSTTIPPERVTPVPPDKHEPPLNIMGEGKTSAEKLTRFFENNSPWTDMVFVQMLMCIYIEESAIEGVNHDIAFVQMCLETGFLNYGGLVQPEWNNFCGLGAIGPEQPGLVFPDPRTGVRAHIQHLKAYGCEEPLNQELVDPRFRYVRRGSSPTIEGLAGTWAADRAYAVKLNNILKRLYDFSF
ncbi:MAG: glucosaminidase domain-containing protein [Treponema sp.]|nr:glucosaminidase domain-containing protein [Treponema sp.]